MRLHAGLTDGRGSPHLIAHSMPQLCPLQNVDHLFKKPFGTMAFTYACCNPNGPAIPSGGLWVVEPSLEIGTKVRPCVRGVARRG